MSKRQIPNMITTLRLLLVLPVAFCLMVEAYRQALLLFFVAGVSDGLDGYLARRFQWSSRFGAITDPLADKLLLVTTFICLTLSGHLPAWLTLLVLGRDLVIVAGALVYHYHVGPYDMRPTWLGKLSTLSQIIYVLMLILVLAGVSMPAAAPFWGLWLVAGLTLVSGFHYVWTWGGRYIRATNLKRSSP